MPRTRTQTPVDTLETADRLRLSATRLARRLRQESSVGLTPSQLSALATVERHGPLALSELADHERITRPSATRVTAKLEEAGLVVRTADTADGRVQRVAVTPAGTALLAESRSRKSAWLAAQLAQLDPVQLACLAGALDALDALTVAEAPTPHPRGAP